MGALNMWHGRGICGVSYISEITNAIVARLICKSSMPREKICTQWTGFWNSLRGISE